MSIQITYQCDHCGKETPGDHYDHAPQGWINEAREVTAGQPIYWAYIASPAHFCSKVCEEFYIYEHLHR